MLRSSSLCSGSLGVAALAAAAGGLPSFAQEEDAQNQGVETIVVTATFRETNVQDTPIAITAVNAEMMEARSQVTLTDIRAPNVTLRPHGQAFGSSLVAFIRGVGQTDFNFASEPGVGVYVDDVYYSSITGNLLDLLDLERAEILRGPQGTLAGKNSIGGAIKLFTREPTGEGDGFIEGTYGSFDRVDFRGAGDFTVVEDKLFVRLSGAARDRSGYVGRYDYACLHADAQAAGFPQQNVGQGCFLGTEGGQSYTSARLAARWLASDRVEVNIAADATNDQSEVQAGVLVRATEFDPAFVPPVGISASAVPIFFDVDGDGLFDADVNGDYTWQPGEDIPYDNRFVTHGPFRGDTAATDGYTSYASYLDFGQNPVPSQCQLSGVFGLGCKDLNHFKPVVVPPINHFDSWGASANVDIELADNLTLTSITAYRTYENTFANDDDGSPLAVQQLLQTLEQEQWSQEVRLNGALFDEAVEYTVGAFYMDRDGTLQARVDLPYTGFDFIHGPDPTPSTTQAVFVNVDWTPIERFNIAGGLRYSEDEKSYTFHRHNPDGSDIPASDACTLPPWIAGEPDNCAVAGGGGVPLDGLTADFTSDRLDYRLALSYELTDDVMLYGQTSTGYKGGGINPRPFVPDQAVGYDPEVLTVYEIGAKSTLFDNRIRLNAAYFFNQYEDIQLIQRQCLDSASTTCLRPFNGGDADVDGFEVEVEARPIDGLLIDASVSTLSFEYTRLTDPSAGVTDQMITPYTPETTWSAGVQYEFELPGNMGSLTPRFDVNYQSEVFTEAPNDATNQIDEYTVANVRLTWRAPDDQWSVSVFGTNVADEYYYLTKNDLARNAGFVYGQPGRPQEWGVTVKRNF